jgi:hypothetical protein
MAASMASALLCIPCRADVLAESEAASPTPEPEDPRITAARQEFLKGSELVSRGAWADALDAFGRSSALRPHPVTTFNAGVCLRAIGAYLRARGKLRDALAFRTGDALPDHLATQARAFIEEIDGILARVTIRVAPHDVSLAIDGRPLEPVHGERLHMAGTLPPGLGRRAPAPIFDVVLDPGSHVFVVSRKGFTSKVVNQTLAPGAVESLDLRLERLPARLEIDTNVAEAVVFLDGLEVGVAPVKLNRPGGTYHVTIRKAGYVPYDSRVVARAGEDLTIRGSLTPEQPFTLAFSVEGFAGYGIGSSFGSDMEASCGRAVCGDQSMVQGPIVGARALATFPMGISLELGAGFFSLSTELKRELDDSYDAGGGETATVTYAYQERIGLQGPFVVGGAGYGVELTERLSLGFRLNVGLAFASASDEYNASATAYGRTVPADVENSGKPVNHSLVFLMPEARIGWGMGAFYGGVGFGALVFPSPGPNLETGDTQPTDYSTCSGATPPFPVECAQGSTAVAGERSSSQFIVWVPSVNAGYRF